MADCADDHDPEGSGGLRRRHRGEHGMPQPYDRLLEQPAQPAQPAQLAQGNGDDGDHEFNSEFGLVPSGTPAEDMAPTPPSPPSSPPSPSPPPLSDDEGSPDTDASGVDSEPEAPAGEAEAPASETEEEEAGSERFCRICYDDTDGGEMGFLFSPCLCKGSCALVHVACLNTWRSMSANKNSAFKCDMCKYQYKIGKREAAKLNFAQLIGHPWFAAVAAVALLVTIVVTVGIVLEVFDYGELVNTVADLDVSMPIRVMSSGVSAVGMCGFLVQQMFWGGARMLFHFGRDRDNGGIMKAIVILIGIVSTYYHIYGWVKNKVRDATYGGTMTILDVHGRVPGVPTPQPAEKRVVTEVD